jgi:hypothetical protein
MGTAIDFDTALQMLADWRVFLDEKETELRAKIAKSGGAAKAAAPDEPRVRRVPQFSPFDEDAPDELPVSDEGCDSPEPDADDDEDVRTWARPASGSSKVVKSVLPGRPNVRSASRKSPPTFPWICQRWRWSRPPVRG